MTQARVLSASLLSGSLRGAESVTERLTLEDNRVALSLYGERNANLKVIERFTMTSPKTIRYQFTVDDPTTWTRPWSGEYEMTRIDGPLFEYACHEGNYGIATILRGARLAEANK